MKFLTKEIKIALVAVCGLVILFFGMNFLKGLNLFSSANKYYISFYLFKCRQELFLFSAFSEEKQNMH